MTAGGVVCWMGRLLGSAAPGSGVVCPLIAKSSQASLDCTLIRPVPRQTTVECASFGP